MERPYRVAGAETRSPRLPAYGVRAGVINAWSTVLLATWIITLTVVTPATADQTRLLAFGDSLVAGYGLPQDQGFTAQLESALRKAGYDIAVTNAGSSGDTTAGGRSRVAWSLADKPDAAIVVLGGNDGLRGLDPSQTHANLAAILTEFSNAGVPVLLAGMLAPPNLGRAYGEEFSAAYRRLDAEFDVVFYPFFLDGVAAEADLNQPDGIHPNEKGVAEIVERMLPSLKDLLARAGVEAS